MPSKVMGGRHMSLSCFQSPPPDTSSFFSEEIRVAAEMPVQFWRSDAGGGGDLPYDGEGLCLMSGGKLVSPSPLDKLMPMEARSHCNLEDQGNIDSNHLGFQRPIGLSPFPLKHFDYDAEYWSHPVSEMPPLFSHGKQSSLNGTYHENGILLKSQLLPANGKTAENVGFEQSEYESFELTEEIEAQILGNLLPDDDDLLSGVFDDVGLARRYVSGDDNGDDIFITGGGMELESDANLKGIGTAEAASCTFRHEQPSRTIVIRNIDSNADDAELRMIFEQYGDVSALYTACKDHGIIMISYYDIRSAQKAMRALQNKLLWHRKMNAHYSLPKSNPLEKNANNGILVIYDPDPSISNDDLCYIFGSYGDIKEIRDIPQKCIEFYDVRAAEAAFCALNQVGVAGKRFKLEPGHCGTEFCSDRMVSHVLDELEVGYSNGCRPDCPGTNYDECFGLIHAESSAIYGSARKCCIHCMHSQPHRSGSAFECNGISMGIPQSLSPLVGRQCNESALAEVSRSLGGMRLGFQNMASAYPHSLPEFQNGATNALQYNLNTMSPNVGMNGSLRASEEIGLSLDHHKEGAFASRNGSYPRQQPMPQQQQFLLSNSTTFHHSPSPQMLWSNSTSPFVSTIPSHLSPHRHGIPSSPSHLLDGVLHHIGSAPTMLDQPLWDRRRHSTTSPASHLTSLGSVVGFPGSPQLHSLEINNHAGAPSPQQCGHNFQERNLMLQIASPYGLLPAERMRARRSDTTGNQNDSKKQYELDIDRILRGEDSRTTLMIKNIPNKYTSKMLLAAIDEGHKGTYDFIYLPIDFKNKCNVGYAFINMTSPKHITPLYQKFNGKKWEKFNSEKVASLAYARIQGKPALIAHFQNSSLMNEDKRCRPILFHTDGPNAGDQEPFPIGVNVRSRSGKPRPCFADDATPQDAQPTAAKGEPFPAAIGITTAPSPSSSSSGSTKDSE